MEQCGGDGSWKAYSGSQMEADILSFVKPIITERDELRSVLAEVRDRLAWVREMTISPMAEDWVEEVVDLIDNKIGEQ
jgi:hypothetical protein